MRPAPTTAPTTAPHGIENVDHKKWDSLDVPIIHEGRAITLPSDPSEMPTEKAIAALQRKLKDENETFRVHEVIDAYPLDAAVAFVRAMQKLYGWASPQATPGFFGPTPPTMVSVKTGPGDAEVVQVPMGAFTLPGIDEPVNSLIHSGVFIIHAEIKKEGPARAAASSPSAGPT